MGFFRSFKKVWDVTIPLLQINALRPACLSPWWQIHYPKLHVHSYKEAKEDPWFLLRNLSFSVFPVQRDVILLHRKAVFRRTRNDALARFTWRIIILFIEFLKTPKDGSQHSFSLIMLSYTSHNFFFFLVTVRAFFVISHNPQIFL